MGNHQCNWFAVQNRRRWIWLIWGQVWNTLWHTLAYNRVLALNNLWNIFSTPFYQQKLSLVSLLLSMHNPPPCDDFLECPYVAFKIVQDLSKWKLLCLPMQVMLCEEMMLHKNDQVRNSKGFDTRNPQKVTIFCTNLFLQPFFVTIYKELNKACTK